MAPGVISGAKDIARQLDRSERWLRKQLRKGGRLAEIVRIDDGGKLYALEHDLRSYLESLPTAATRVRG